MRPRDVNPEGDVLEGGNRERDVILVREVEVDELTRQPPAVEAGNGKRISRQCW